MFERYVVGYAYCEAVNKVVLIRRAKDDWMQGKLNGLGGRCGRNEASEEAMAREFLEEAGIEVGQERWQRVVSMVINNERKIDFFLTRIHYEELRRIGARCDEGQIVAVPVSSLGNLALVPNANWVVGMALDPDLIKPVHVESR